MRDLKFRAWDKILNDMAPVCRIDFCGKVDFGPPNVSVQMRNKIIIRTSRLEDCILMQYTGLKDKNGKEIYEGDKVRINYADTCIYGHVVYDAPSFKTNNGFALAHVPTYMPDSEPHTIEVIGNIHETPDLIKHDN